MGKKVAIGTAVGFVALFILGWVVYGMLLKDTMAKAYADSGMNMEPGMVHIILATIVQALLITLILYKFNVTTFMGGLIAAGWVSFLIGLMYAIWHDTSYSWYTMNTGVMEVVVGTVTTAIGGGIIGWVMGKVK
jgi:ABC-type cobalt transport system substrate-binding protein